MIRSVLITAAIALLTSTLHAQTDTTKPQQPDTVRVGNFIIIKKGRGNTDFDSTRRRDHRYSLDINIGSNTNRRRNRSNISTNWFIFDLGFANYRDKTDYASPEAINFLHADQGAHFTKDDLKLNTGKSSNVNIWVFMQKLNVTHHVLNLKYGLGLEMYNYRYDANITYHDNPTYIYRDTVDFSKNKLYVGYATIPFMINVNATPAKKRGFGFSAGVSAGYRIGSHTKQISDERGKIKNHSDFNLDPWRFAYIAEIGIGPVRVYGSYSINALHEDGLTQYPYVIGLRLSNW